MHSAGGCCAPAGCRDAPRGSLCGNPSAPGHSVAAWRLHRNHTLYPKIKVQCLVSLHHLTRYSGQQHHSITPSPAAGFVRSRTGLGR